MSFLKKLFGFEEKEKVEEVKEVEENSDITEGDETESVELSPSEAFDEAIIEDKLFQQKKDSEDLAKYHEVSKMAIDKKYEEEIIDNSAETVESFEIEDEDLPIEEDNECKILKEIHDVDSSSDFDKIVDDVKQRLEKLDKTSQADPDNLIDLENHNKENNKFDIVMPSKSEEEVIIFANDNTDESVVLEEQEVSETTEQETSVEEQEVSETTEQETSVEEQQENLEEFVEDTEESSLSFFEKLKKGLSKTKNAIFAGIEDVLSNFTSIDESLFEELEESLILADIGVETSLFIIDKLRKEVRKGGVTDVSQIKATLEDIIAEILSKDVQPLVYNSPTVILVIGVNGAGKTTTIGKLTHKLKSEGKSVLLAAGDTFRAAAIDQLEVWSKRNNVDLIKHQENSDPAAVVFDACKSAKAKKTDILIVDTAGRLQNKKNLMEELKKIRRIIDSEYSDAQLEVFLVLDGTTGQNAVSQAKIFNEVVNVTGLVITKLDGTAKGGIVVSIFNEMNLPVRYVGLGEKINDLEEFNSKDFAKALFE